MICPSILASTVEEYATQIKRVSPFAKRIQIDLMDGKFASPKSIGLEDVWWPHHLQADLHLMYQRPMDHIDAIIKLKPNLVIFHVEATFHHMHMAAELHKEGIQAGLAILPDTPIDDVQQILSSFEHLMLFSGNLGHFGGHADLSLLSKVQEAKAHHPDLEFGWDGGVNGTNVAALSNGGIDVLNVGGYLQHAHNPVAAYNKLWKSEQAA